MENKKETMLLAQKIGDGCAIQVNATPAEVIAVMAEVLSTMVLDASNKVHDNKANILSHIMTDLSIAVLEALKNRKGRMSLDLTDLLDDEELPEDERGDWN